MINQEMYQSKIAQSKLNDRMKALLLINSQNLSEKQMEEILEILN